jgi:hypothetical protein
VNELVAVLAAVAAAVTFGASDVIEQRATHEVAERKLLDPRLFVDLLRTRLWVTGILCCTGGLALFQAFARPAGLAVMTAGVYALTHRSPQLTARSDPGQRRPAPH